MPFPRLTPVHLAPRAPVCRRARTDGGAWRSTWRARGVTCQECRPAALYFSQLCEHAAEFAFLALGLALIALAMVL